MCQICYYTHQRICINTVDPTIIVGMLDLFSLHPFIYHGFMVRLSLEIGNMVQGC
jgi:hypothetical protein